MKDILHINSVKDYLHLRGQEVLHPLIGIVDFNKINESKKVAKKYDAFHFDCYAIFLKDAKGCKMKYGGKPYDYDEGTLVYIGPNQSIEVGGYAPGFKPEGYALLFHPDLLEGSNLKNKMSEYGFFSYTASEALHLSAKERKVIVSLIEKIEFELEQNIDKHSKKLILSNLELFLDYSMRFYDRQFITRETSNIALIENFNAELTDYFLSNKPQTEGLPSVSYFADQLHLSPNYFGDLIKKETGKTAQEYVQNKLIEVAKFKVHDSDKSISEIAYELGFKYPQHFTRTFKQHVGSTPKKYRSLN